MNNELTYYFCYAWQIILLIKTAGVGKSSFNYMDIKDMT